MRTERLHGMLVMTASSVLFSAMSLLVPYARSVSTYVVASTRFVTGGVAILVLGFLGVIKLKAVNRGWLIVRGLFGAVSVYLFYYGIVKLGLGMGTVLNNTYPIFAALLAPILLKEKLKPDVIAAVVVSFMGIYFIVNPEGVARLFRGEGLAGAFAMSLDGLLALLGGVLAAVAVVAVKKLRETDSSSIIYLAQCAFGVIVIGYPAATSSFAFSLSMWIVLLGIGILATAAQLLMTSAFKHLGATEGSLLGFLVPVLNMALGAIVFGETIRPIGLTGCLIVLICCVYVALRERIVKLVG